MSKVIDQNAGAVNPYEVISKDGGMDYEIKCVSCGKVGKKNDKQILNGTCHK